MRITRNSLGHYVVEDEINGGNHVFVFHDFSTVIGYIQSAFGVRVFNTNPSHLFDTGPRTSPSVSVSPSVSPSPSYSGSASPSPSLAPEPWEEPESSMPEYIPWEWRKDPWEWKERKKKEKNDKWEWERPNGDDADNIIMYKEEE